LNGMNSPGQKQAGASKPPPSRKVAHRARAAALEHELHVHQVELEMQNEELRRAELDLAAVRDRFIDLYDFAPVGYFTLNEDGSLVEANLTAATMLGEQRKALVKNPFARFVVRADAHKWHLFFAAALKREGPQRLELALQPRDKIVLHGRLDCVSVLGPEGKPLLRVALTDITQRIQAERERRIAAAASETREAERRLVARELHEELGQRLSALKMQLSSLRPGTDPSAQNRHVEGMLESLDIAVAMVRRIATDLRPLMLDDLGLNAAIDWLARDSSLRLGMKITVGLAESDPPLDEHLSIAIYRLLQGTLAHIARHARATDVRIDMLQKAGDLVLTIQDNAPTQTERPGPSGVADAADGALALHQQARLMGGEWTQDEVAEDGQRFTFRMPLFRRPFPPVETIEQGHDWHKLQDQT
jgi:two-component system sensor histidine kinase UhpB